MDGLACSQSHDVACTSSADTSTRYRTYVLAAFLVGLVVVSPMAFLLPLEKALWAYAQWDLGDEPVVGVTFEGQDTGQVSRLDGSEAGLAARAFLDGSYCQSNPDGRGPAPQARVSIAFSGGKTVQARMWPDGRFEVSDFGRSYLVSSPVLSRMVQQQVHSN